MLDLVMIDVRLFVRYMVVPLFGYEVQIVVKEIHAVIGLFNHKWECKAYQDTYHGTRV